jgi:basic membrane protein A and related proteins
MKKSVMVISMVICTVMLLTACAPKPEATALATSAAEVATAPAPTAPAAPTESPVASGPCLIIGATYGGYVNDSGYNQAMHEAVMDIKKSIPCVSVIEAENVYDEAGAISTMQNMISQGAKMIIATGFSHQVPALALSQTHPDVIFEHAGGWSVRDNFGTFFGNPPDGWYLMGIAAGKMTTSNKIGFVANAPFGWALTFINAFELGVQSVNPDAETYVTFTQTWGDSAKEAEATNALINQGADVISMFVDSPVTIIGTAESRGVYSIGFQNLAAQQFAPEFWISGTYYTLGPTLTRLTQEVINHTWGDEKSVTCGISAGCMGIAPFGPKVPQEVKDLVMAKLAEIDAGTLVVFKGPIVDQNGNVVVAEGDVLTPDKMSGVDWFVKGVVGSPK